MNAFDFEWGARNWNRALVLVLGLACLFRLWGTWYGLPYSYYDDEYHEVMRALELGMGGFNFERTGKGGFYFLLFLEYGLYYVSLKLWESSTRRGSLRSTLSGILAGSISLGA